jgi:hypothetical protein
VATAISKAGGFPRLTAYFPFILHGLYIKRKIGYDTHPTGGPLPGNHRREDAQTGRQSHEPKIIWEDMQTNKQADGKVIS